MNEDLFKELLIVAKAMDAPPVQPSARAERRFAALFGPQPARVISEAQMRLVILKVLSKGRADGGEVVHSVRDLNLRLETEGEGLIFALLARMEESGILSGEFDASMTRKTYALTDRGSGILEREGSSVSSLNPLLAALWAT